MNITELRLQILLQLIDKSGVGVDQWDEPKIQQATDIANALADGIWYGGDEEFLMATSKQYAFDEDTIIFGDEAGDDVAWTTAAIANGAGRQSTLYDLGAIATARSDRFHYRFKTDGWQATPTVGNTLDLHIKTSDGTTPDNDDGTTDAAVSAEDKLRNLDYIDEIVCDEAAANIPAATWNYLHLPERYVGFALWNRGGSALKNADTATKLFLYPRPLQQQAT